MKAFRELTAHGRALQPGNSIAGHGVMLINYLVHSDIPEDESYAEGFGTRTEAHLRAFLDRER